MATPALHPDDVQHDAPPRTDFVDSLIGLFDAGQAVVLDRIDLLRMQFADDVVRFAVSAALIATGSAVTLGGYVVLMAGVVGLMVRAMDWEWVLCVVGGAHLMLGAVLTLIAIRLERVRRTRESAMQEMIHAQ